ncbi:hypothetical protein ACLSU7_01035 [Bdellovibrio sp. HCB185ZH]|uniref:hypothetical protein n=1 Tax=Bdellovibrio sp. HCB185ZH TaxID=3394235 RepID=UPI0039A53B6E
MIYIFSPKVPGEFLSHSDRLREQLPLKLKHITMHPAEIVDDINLARISLIGLIQKWRQLKFLILDESGNCLETYFY